MAEPLETDLPYLMEVGEMSSFLPHPSFHESSTNVSLADSAAATLGSESAREAMSDRGINSSNSSSNSSDDSDECSDAESPSEKSNNDSEKLCYKQCNISTDDDWIEETYEDEHMHKIKCLFCTEILHSVSSLLEHCQQVHQFFLQPLKHRHGMDCYSFIRLVNFIRSCNPTSREVMELDLPIWEQDKFMKPAIEDDPLLMYDFDEEQAVDAIEGAASKSGESELSAKEDTPVIGKIVEPLFGPGTVHVANAEGGHVTLTQNHFDGLHAALQKMQLLVDETNATLSQCRKDMETMKKAMQHIVLGDKHSDNTLPSSPDENDDEEDGYFSGYAHFSIHHDMLSDKTRTESYKEAIMKNRALIQDKVVMDLGCGTGILSMFAVQSGAAKVIGVDQSQIIFNAMGIIRENKMENKIKLIRGRIEEVSLTEPIVDVLISEWMGYFLLFEGMLDSVIYARNKYLAPNGTILPNMCSIKIAAIGDTERYQEMIGFWDNVYELKMSSMKPEVLREASIETVPADKIISDSVTVLSLDLRTCHVQDTEFFTPFTLRMSRNEQITALCGYFDVSFDLEHPVVLSTSCLDPPTHWKQTVFYLPEPITVTEGQLFECSIEVRRHSKESRWLQIALVVNGEKLKYTLC